MKLCSNFKVLERPLCAKSGTQRSSTQKVLPIKYFNPMSKTYIRAETQILFDNVPVATDTIAFHITGFLVFNIGINRLAVISPHVLTV